MTAFPNLYFVPQMDPLAGFKCLRLPLPQRFQRCRRAVILLSGSALTTFNKGGVDLSPIVIAHRSSYTRGELLINPKEFQSFKHKVHIIDHVPPPPTHTHITFKHNMHIFDHV